MTALFRRVLCLFVAMLINTGLDDAQAADDSTNKTWDGYLGAGIMSIPKYAGSDDKQTLFITLAMLEYGEMAYIHRDRVGVRLWNSDGKKMAFGIAAQPRFGFYAKDGVRLSGMSARHDAAEGGPISNGNCRSCHSAWPILQTGRIRVAATRFASP